MFCVSFLLRLCAMQRNLLLTRWDSCHRCDKSVNNLIIKSTLAESNGFVILLVDWFVIPWKTHIYCFTVTLRDRYKTTKKNCSNCGTEHFAVYFARLVGELLARISSSFGLHFTLLHCFIYLLTRVEKTFRVAGLNYSLYSHTERLFKRGFYAAIRLHCGSFLSLFPVEVSTYKMAHFFLT